MFHRTRTAMLAAAATLALGAPALAGGPGAAPGPAKGNPHVTAPGQSNPAQPGAGTQNNPNGTPPIGQPSPGSASSRGNQLGRPSPMPSAAPSAAPSVMPSVVPSAVPSVVPSAVPSVVPSAVPSLLPVSARAALHGTLTSLSGTTAIVKLANGTSQTYTVSAKTAAILKHRIGKKVAFRVLNGALLIGGK